MSQLNTKRPAAIALITILLVAVFALATITTVTMFSISDLQMASAESTSEQVFQAAEAGINDALYKLGQNSTFCPDGQNSTLCPDCPVTQLYSNMLIGGVSVDTSVCNISGKKHIVAEASGSNNTKRSLAIDAYPTSFGGFRAAIQTGVGAFEMKNDDHIIGDVYSNGPITSQGTTDIKGDVWVAGENKIEGTTVLAGTNSRGNVYAYEIKNTTVAGEAFYNIASGTVKANGGSETCGLTSGTYCHPGTIPHPGGLPNKPYPLPFDYYRADDPTTLPIEGTLYKQALAGGTTCSTACTVNTGDTIKGYYNGGLTISGNVKLVGTVWVKGNLTINGDIQLCKAPDPCDYGPNSEAIVATGIVTKASGTILGTNDAKSTILIITLSNANPAIDALPHDNKTIIFAPNGTIGSHPNDDLTNAIGAAIEFQPNMTVTFNPNFAYVNIPGDPTHQVMVPETNTWTEQ